MDAVFMRNVFISLNKIQIQNSLNRSVSHKFLIQTLLLSLEKVFAEN